MILVYTSDIFPNDIFTSSIFTYILCLLIHYILFELFYNYP